MSDNIKVVVKVRPLITREIAEKQVYQWRVHNNTLHQLDSNSRDVVQTFTFDKIYNENAKTSDVYNDVAKPIVEAATAGFNGTIFAYGQTSSGKTYTMTGTEDSPGIIPLAVFNLFENIKNIPNRDFLVRVSYLEIYNETLKDLLDIKRENIKIHETYDGNIKVDASENVTASPEEVLEAMKKGEANRQTGATNMNEKSSRSHSIFQITIESREHIEGEEQTGCVNVSQLNLVDLAGSERAGQTGATGLRFKEGTHINKSLSALALVIKQLSDDPNKYANYRDSKLTRILQNSLGGNAKTSIICAITPAAIEETISTLQFATRAKAIKNKPEVNAVVEADKTMIQGLTKQLSKLQTELQNKKNLEVMLENKKHVEQDLQKQIANLQKLILNGFGRRQSIEHIGGTRRMLQAPRRQTISTLHSISDDPVPDVPRFCTPHLKYNPLTVQNPSEFVPLQSGNKLPSLPEEPPRLITTPPSNRRVQFKAGHEDIIELDSDDEEDPETSVSTCSPYHRCYNETKTPPCVLRRNAKEAEKNYNEIIEFTTLEKMYEPTVIELMQKIEQSTIMTTKLQDEIETLRQSSKQKDLEVEHLQCKIKKNEEEFKKTKLELDTCRKEFMTKLTDWEVSYETLQKKAKLREDDLLSLLEEQKQKKCEEIGKQPQKNLETISFIDMSIKDISLVTSDNENSIINPNEDSEKRQDLVTTLQDQLTTKNQVILQLEADIASQKKFIEHLEQSSSDIQKSFDEISTKAGYLEDENKLLQTNVDTLNATLKCQKENFEAVQIDMNSYKSLIQELQIKLSNKDNLLSMNINNSTLENMIANEEKALANNENMKNIIHCFKLTLDNRTKEIEDLKSSMKTSRDIASMDCIEKTKQIDTLNEEIFALKEQINDSIKTINNLIQEKKNLSKVEKELTEKLSEVERQKNELYELNKENAVQIDKLKEISDSNLSLLNAKEQEYANNSRQLQSQIDTLTKKIMETEEDYKEKSIILIELEKHNKEKQDFELKAKLAVDKLQNVISILNGEVKQIPELLDDLIALFNTMFIGFNTLEQLANDTVADKNNVIKQNTQLKTDIVEIHTKYDNEITSLQRDIENTKKSVENQLTENAYLKNANDKLTEEIKEIRKELEGKCKEYKTLQELCENIKVSENSLKEKLQNLQHDILVQKTYETDKLKCDLIEKCSEIANLERKLNDLTQVKEHFVDSISAKLCRIISELKTENTLEDRSKYDLEHILSMLDTIVNYIEHNNSVNAQNVATIEHVLHNSKQELETALVENNTLKNKLSDIESENKKLTLELERNYVDGKNMNENLTLSNDLLEQLREDLRIKAAEIESMENKAKEWKEQFLNLDTIMKEQMTYLQHENENLKSRVEELKFTSKQKVDTLTNYDENGSGFKEDTSKPEVKGLIETMSPPSLLTICCNTIVEAIEPKQNDYCSDITSSSDAESPDNVKCSTCEQLSLDLRFSKQENSALTTIIEHLEIANKDLLQEQGNIRREVQLLLEPAQELHKKIAGHKTNLSILTATSYAENKLLKSQVKSLQHHHNRFLNVCARDIPEFKRQLNELWTVLKEDSTASAAQNINLKRYSLPDVLDNFKNESTLDGDLLMLDTNVTLTTTGNNTLVGCDQTCLDITQTYNEVSCQTDEIDQTDVHSHTSLIDIGNQNNMSQNLEILKEQNCKLKELFDNVSVHSKVDAITSPIKIPTPDVLCKKCTLEKEMPKLDYKEVERLTQIVTQMQTEKDIIETKYNNLLLEVPSTDKLVIKIKDLEKVLNIKTEEINKLNGVLNKNLIEMKLLQEENDSLSTQVMENISEADDLHKELDRLKALNLELIEKIQKYETDTVNNTEIRQLDFKDDVVNSENKASPHSKLGRSFSDSDTTTTYNKICTLQNELCAGREDCKELREDVASIKLQLECSNMSIDLNENTEDTKDGKPQYHETKSCMPDIQEERLLDIYSVEKNDCCNYYREITGVDKEHLQSDIKIVDIMKMFYENLVTKHSNEVENLLNKLKDYEELRNTLQKKIDDMTSEYTTITETVLKKEKDLKIVSKIIHQLNAEINKINLQVSNLKDREDLKETANMFKEKILNEVDYEFGISSSNIFNMIIENYEKELFDIEKQCTSMQSQNNNLTSDLETANRNLTELKSQMTEKVKEYNLLNAQKLKIHEISSAVTMDIVKREQEINNILKESSHKLLKLNIISSELNLTGSLAHNIDTMVNCIISNIKLLLDKQKEYENEVVLKAKESAIISEQKDKEVNILKTQIQSLKDLNKNLTIELTNKELKLKDSEAQCNDLNKSYNVMEKENKNNLILINKLTEELSDAKTANLRTLKDLKEDNERLKSVNQIILKEKETYSIDLEKAGETINQNNAELGKMTSDILMLRESTKEATSIIESLKREIMKLSAENSELKQRFEEKSQECSRHEFNVRTHDKAAAIQNNIIKSLKKVKEENDELIKEKQNKIVEVTQKCTELQNECQQLKDALTTSREEVDKFKTANEVLETRISELEEATNKPRSSLEAIADSSRRRRQSLHDSKRILDLDEHDSDLFMKIDDDNSGRSTPFGLHRGRDSLPFKTDQSDRESEGGSRAAVARRRRQGQHDVRRDLSNSLQSRSRDTSATHGSNEVTQLKEQLASMTIELEGLKEKYRELDEECEICGQYLQERDAMCSQLRKENKALEVQLQELKAKSETEKHTSRHSLSKPTVADVAVNTDKDWANLHAVVVDRMSFDAEVEKNKKLKKTVEELRFKNQDLKNTMAKMQKALDKNSSKDTKELEATKEELEYVKAELQELKISYKALDEECEICAQYLREREDQCRKLREAKTALENKLQELQEASHSALAHSVRKKRQTIHDLNRHSIMEQNDASTETNEGLTSYQVERDDSSRKADDAQLREVKRLKMMIEKLSHQNAAMEQQLRSQQSSTNPVYVATGSAIVQNQQLSDVMKENQRLKIKNQKLASYCKKLTKSDANRENEDPCDQG